MKMTTQIAENIIQEVQTDLETISDFCHYNKMGEEITFMENATVIFKKHVDLTEEEEMAIRAAISIGYSAGMQYAEARRQYFIRLHWGQPMRADRPTETEEGEQRMKVGDRVKDRLYTARSDGRGIGTITEIIPLDHPVPDRDEQHFNYCCMVRWDKPLENFCRWYEDPHVSQDYLDDIELLESEE